MTPQRDDLLLRLPCYEPAGQSVELTLDDLTQHLLVVGSTGAGKTSLLNEVLWQLLHYRAADPTLKLGMLILDGKADDTVAKVMAWATAAGRAGDVQVLNGDGTATFPLFAPLTRLAAVDQVTAQVLSAASSMSVENQFWAESRAGALRAALSTLVYLPAVPPNHTDAVEAIGAWLLRNQPPQDVLNHLRRLVKSRSLSAFARQRVGAVLTFAELWRTLDDRTRGNIQATLVPVLNALGAAAAENYFAAPQGAPFLPRAAVESGKIMVASANAITEPDFTRFLFRLLKESFFAAVHERTRWELDRQRLAVLFVDEWPLAVTPRDAIHLGTCRSKGAAVVAATQGLAPLNTEVGHQHATTLLLNLNSFAFMRCRELEVELFAARQMGTTPVKRRHKITREEDSGGLVTAHETSYASTLPTAVCPLGVLGQLEAHQAFVAVGATRHSQPVWFVPRFFEPGPAEQRLLVSDSPAFLNLEELRYEADRLDWLMTLSGKRLHRHEPLVEVLGNRPGPAAADRWRGELRTLLHACALGTPSEASLLTLPVTWLRGLVGVLVNLVHTLAYDGLPQPLVHLGQWRGRLVTQFAGEVDYAAIEGGPVGAIPTALDALRGELQGPLYPSVYRPLLQKDHAWLWRQHPELRPALSRLSTASTLSLE